MWISVPIASTDPAGAGATQSQDALGRADPVGELDDVVRALRVHDHLDAGVLGPGGLDVLGTEALVHRAVALPEQQRRVLDVAVLEAAALGARVPDPHVVGAEAHVEAGVAPEVLVGEEEHLVAAGPSAHSSTARAFDDVQTAPPWRPTNAFSAAEEFM